MQLIDKEKLLRDIKLSNLEFFCDGKVLKFVLDKIENQKVIEYDETK